MDALKIIISGLYGKMGQAVLAAAIQKGYSVVAGIDTAQKTSGIPVRKDFTSLPDADVIIDFSRPSTLPGLLDYAVKTKTPAVIATTGYSEDETAQIFAASKKTAIFFSRNMSLGVSLLCSLAERAAAVLKGCDVEIIEKHHNQKIDAPSGTALMLCDAVKKGSKEDLNIVGGRTGGDCKRKAGEIGVHAIRGGMIVGEHEIMFIGKNETITLSHSVNDRAVFAQGALAAAEFIRGKKAGLYGMGDLV